MRATSEQFVGLFKGLGFASADKWSSSRLVSRIGQMPKISGDCDKGRLDAEQVEMLNDLLNAIANGERVSVSDLQEEEIPSKRKKASKGVTKVVEPDEEDESKEEEAESSNEDKPKVKKVKGKKVSKPSDEVDKPKKDKANKVSSKVKGNEKEVKEKASKNGKAGENKKEAKNGKRMSIGKARYNFMELPVTAVLRWMGSKEWNFKRARMALDKYGQGLENVSDATIRTQLGDGKSGRCNHGPIPDMSSAQIKKVEALGRQKVSK